MSGRPVTGARPVHRRGLASGWCQLALVVITAAPVSAQDPQDLAGTCDALGGDSAVCALAAGAARDLMGDVGLLAGPGSDVPGQSSALGRRIGGTPRFAPFFRVGGHSVVVPDLASATATGEQSPFVTAVHGGLGLGVFDGFYLLPTVGGFLSLDVVGQASFLLFPEGDGFDGRVDVFSVGARVGLVRESFTLPGVTLSVSRRFSGPLRLGDTGAGDSGQVAIDPSVTSLRATVGKDLFAFGVLAGVGWDDFSSATSVRVTDGAGGEIEASTDLEGSRALYFFGLSKQLGVLAWVSAEVGWARGHDPVALGPTSSPDRGSTVFGSVALLLKL